VWNNLPAVKSPEKLAAFIRAARNPDRGLNPEKAKRQRKTGNSQFPITRFSGRLVLIGVLRSTPLLPSARSYG
jgi:hypothetical protein